ncbi:MAG: maleylpyruvate isomerase N-terminal domain-containing protein, partial [Acidimicrobiales bacterium]
MDPISVLRKAVDQTGRIVAGVKPEQLAVPTPCDDWDLRALLNHTIGVVEMFDDAAQTKPFNGSIFA